MWQSLNKFIYGMLYRLGKSTPSSAEIAAELKRLEAREPPSPLDAHPRPTGRCDCHVLAGGRTVDCQPDIATFACELIGESMPGLNGVPLPLGSCGNLPRPGAQ